MLVPWKKSYDQSIQHIKKQRYYFANKGQSYGSSSESEVKAAQSCPTLTSIHDYGNNIALIIQTSVGKAMFLLFNTLSRFVMAFLPRSKCLLISWLQLPSAVILEPPKIKSITVSIVSTSICHEMMP